MRGWTPVHLGVSRWRRFQDRARLDDRPAIERCSTNSGSGLASRAAVCPRRQLVGRLPIVSRVVSVGGASGAALWKERTRARAARRLPGPPSRRFHKSRVADSTLRFGSWKRNGPVPSDVQSQGPRTATTWEESRVTGSAAGDVPFARSPATRSSMRSSGRVVVATPKSRRNPLTPASFQWFGNPVCRPSGSCRLGERA